MNKRPELRNKPMGVQQKNIGDYFVLVWNNNVNQRFKRSVPLLRALLELID